MAGKRLTFAFTHPKDCKCWLCCKDKKEEDDSLIGKLNEFNETEEGKVFIEDMKGLMSNVVD